MDISRFKGGKNKTWADWLSDDPLPSDTETPQAEQSTPPRGHRPLQATYKRRSVLISDQPQSPAPMSMSAPAQAQAIAQPQINVPAVPKTVQIDIKLPKPHLKTLSSLRLPQGLPYKRVSVGVATLAVLVVVGGVGRGILSTNHSDSAAIAKSKANKTASAKILDKPSFTPVVPKERPELGQITPGSTTTAFDGSRDSYSFSDAYLGTQLTVSEQPIPSKYTSSDDAVTKAANSIGAKDVIGNSGSLAYMKTDSKTNTQIIVLSKSNLLIFIQSAFKHDVIVWQEYIDSLQ